MKRIIISALILLGIWALFHFVYDWIDCPLFAWIFPTNESIFEHTKLLIFPMSLYFLYDVLIRGKGIAISLYRLNVSIGVGTLFMVVFYYTLTGIIGMNVGWLNVLDLFLSVFLALCVQNKVLDDKDYDVVNNVVVYGCIVLFLVVMTYFPFGIAFFYDFSSNKYGI